MSIVFPELPGLPDQHKMNKTFVDWTKWNERDVLRQLQYPGVYAIALSEQDISATPFSWCEEIFYIGMTNAKGGLKSRLRQFDNTIKGGNGHGGGHRVRFKHPDYHNLARRLYVSVCSCRCDVESSRPTDLRIMGDVAKLEYECFAVFVEKFGRLPEFNDKKRSPKK